MSDFKLVERELARIGADEATSGLRDSIGVNDELGGWASLGATPERADFYWYGRVETMLARLQKLPPGGGAEAVRREFESRYPGLSGSRGVRASGPRTS